ncbi:MAG TPA: cytochrome c biogenesis protein [Candidatus Azoamicus sp. MARI]
MNKYIFIIFISITIYLLTDISSKNSYENFSRIPILFDGKIRPLNSFSKSIFNDLELKHKEYSHIKLLADLLLNFENFSQLKIFNIKYKNLINNFDLKENKNNYYSFDDIANAIKKNYKIINALQNIDYDNRTIEQNEIIKLYYKITYLLKLKNYFPENLYNKNIKPKTQNNDINIQPFYIIPLSDTKWIEPESLISHNLKNEYTFLIVNIIDEMQKSYKKNDIELWSKICKNFSNITLNNISRYNKIKVQTEYLYNKFNFIYISLIFYIIGLITSILSNVLKRNINIYMLSIVLAIFFNLSEIIFRIFLSERAPVTNLYESIVFVNCITAIFFIILYQKIKINPMFIIFITLFQYITYKYSINGTNIKNLVPVLNTNFWLVSHVITITLGYSLCLISGLLAHIYLYFRLDFYKNTYFLKKFLNLIHLFIILSLIFSFCGTVLGGVWADQSWGRFWGWDPKENGAMLIILWLTFIIHLRMVKTSNTLLYINGIILNNIIVFLAWFGVNLLNVGLHSYGFTQNVGFGLIMFLIFEICYILTFQIIFNIKKIKNTYL